jgi:hypothetical protein
MLFLYYFVCHTHKRAVAHAHARARTHTHTHTHTVPCKNVYVGNTNRAGADCAVGCAGVGKMRYMLRQFLSRDGTVQLWPYVTCWLGRAASRYFFNALGADKTLYACVRACLGPSCALCYLSRSHVVVNNRSVCGKKTACARRHLDLCSSSPDSRSSCKRAFAFTSS